MKLLDIYVVINGHLMGPFLAPTPLKNASGDYVAPQAGDEITIYVRPTGEPAVDDFSHVYARANLIRS